MNRVQLTIYLIVNRLPNKTESDVFYEICNKFMMSGIRRYFKSFLLGRNSNIHTKYYAAAYEK